MIKYKGPSFSVFSHLRKKKGNKSCLAIRESFEHLTPPLSTPHWASLQGCGLYSQAPRRKPCKVPLTGHTLDQFIALAIALVSTKEGFNRLQIKGQLHLWDKPFFVSK